MLLSEFFNSGIETSVAKGKLAAFNEYFSQTAPSAGAITEQRKAEDILKTHFQRGFDKLGPQEQKDLRLNIERQILAASVFRYLCLLYVVVGLIVWAQKDVALKLFYPGVSLVIASQFLLNFFTLRSNEMTGGYIPGLLSQILTTIIFSLVSITMILNLALLIVVRLMTDESGQEER